MGEFAYFIAKQILVRLVTHADSYASQEISLAWGARDDLKKLKRTLSSITKLLLDAEEKQTQSYGLTEWLARLKAVCYDIEDVLDVFAYKLLIKTSKGKVRYFFSSQNPIVFDLKMGHKLKEIREKLDEIDKNKNQFSLVERGGGQQDMHRINERETHSVVPSHVIPRRDDQEDIIKYLLNDASSSDENVSVISIIGLGGLGKTTLATLVYNDSMVVGKFDKRLWVCVSNHFNNKRLIREILSQNGKKCEDHESLEVMQKELQSALRGKKILLVLDDVWDEGSIGVNTRKWDDFTSLLSSGLIKGSKIIVTTRNESVGLLVNSIHMHFLKGLSHEDCMSLFIKKAFKSGVDPHQDYPRLMEIGEGIVNKCGGVPLAVTAIGSLLHLKTDPVEWTRVIDDDIWLRGNDGKIVLPALKLSYDALPHHLKPCFAFCSLFPKDHEFDGSELIPLWMAQGYLKCSDDNEDFQQIGLDYIRQFCSRSLFQDAADSIFEIKFKVHDLVHDLAISVAQAEYSSINHRPPSNASEMVRHVSFSREDLSAASMPSHLLEMEKVVRTILFSVSRKEVMMGNPSFVKTFISRLKYCRVLDLSYSSFKELPSLIGNLTHLRYLNLEYCLGICSLPNSICKLLNLQYLNLMCGNLEKLPKDIGNLVNLRYLFLTTLEEYLPKGIGRLSLLQHLFIAGCENLKSLGEEIQCLTNLRELHIVSCPEIESLPPNMERLTSLEQLAISRCEKVDLMKSGDDIRGLRSFLIHFSSSMSGIPYWLENSADTLQILYIFWCDKLVVLPDWLHKSKSLQRLVIDFCPQLSALPDELMHQLTALRHLEIKECDPALIEGLKTQLKGSHVARHGKIILDENPYTAEEGADGGDI